MRKNNGSMPCMEPLKSADLTDYLIACDGFRCLFIMLGGAVPVGMPVAITIGRSTGDGLTRVDDIGGHCLVDVADRADLHDRRVGLLHHQLCVNPGPLDLLLVSLPA